MLLTTTQVQVVTVLSNPYLSLGKTGQIAHISSPFSGIAQKLSSRVTLLRRLVGSGWGAGAKTLRIAALSLVYSTDEYCVPV